MSDVKKGDAKAELHAPATGGTSKLLPLMVGVNSLLLVGVVVFLVLQMKHQQTAMTAALAELSRGAPKGAVDATDEKEEARAEPASEGKAGHGKEGTGAGSVMAKLPDFVVHLRNPDADRYARMSFEVEVFAESDKERINAATPRVRDAFISYLSDRTLEDLRGSEGLARTKESLQSMLRELCPEARIRALYIADFVVQ